MKFGNKKTKKGRKFIIFQEGKCNGTFTNVGIILFKKALYLKINMFSRLIFTYSTFLSNDTH